MVPKIECPHDQKCPSPNACKTRRYREKRQRDDDSEFERSESRRKAKRETMSRRRAFDKELTQLVIDDSVCLLPPSEQEDTILSLRSDLDDSLQTTSEKRAEIRALNEKIRRRDERIAELESQLLELREKRKPKSGEFNAWSPQVVLLAMCLRSAGLGLETTGRVIAFVYHLLLGIVMPTIPQRTIQDWDKIAGPISVQFILESLKTRRPEALAWMQDTSSGARHNAGWSASAVGLSMKHPQKDDRVLCAIVDTRVGDRSLTAVKANQIRSCQERLTGLDLPVPAAMVSDHSNDQAAVAAELAIAYCGCMSHKIAKACESATDAVCDSFDVLKSRTEVMKSHIRALLVALDAARTKATTQSGLLCKAYLFNDDESGINKLAGKREVGHKYAFHLHCAELILQSRQILRNAVARGDLTIPGSDALQSLLYCEETSAYLTTMTIGSWFFHHAIAAFRADGDINYGKAIDVSAQITQLLTRMKASKDINSLKKCFSERNFGILVPGKKGLFGKTWRIFVTALKEKWEYMLSLHASTLPSTAELSATPATNDFVEGFFGYMATLGAKLGPSTHPLRLASLATFAYNQHAMMVLCDNPTPSQDLLTKVRKELEWQSHKEISLRVHKTIVCTRRENEMKINHSADATKTRFREVFGRATPMPGQKIERIRLIVEREYQPPGP